MVYAEIPISIKTVRSISLTGGVAPHPALPPLKDDLQVRLIGILGFVEILNFDIMFYLFF